MSCQNNCHLLLFTLHSGFHKGKMHPHSHAVVHQAEEFPVRPSKLCISSARASFAWEMPDNYTSLWRPVKSKVPPSFGEWLLRHMINLRPMFISHVLPHGIFLRNYTELSLFVPEVPPDILIERPSFDRQAQSNHAWLWFSCAVRSQQTKNSTRSQSSIEMISSCMISNCSVKSQSSIIFCLSKNLLCYNGLMKKTNY